MLVDQSSGKGVQEFLVKDEGGQRGDDVPAQRYTRKHGPCDEPEKKQNMTS